MKTFIPLLLVTAFIALPASAQKWRGDSSSGIYNVPPDPDAVEIHPYLALKIGYDSNVLLEQSGDEQDDIFGEARIGLAIHKPIGPLVVGANASVITEKYIDVSEADDTDVDIDLNIGLNLDDDHFIGNRDTVQISLDVDIIAGQQVDNETGQLEDYSRYGASINAGKTLDNIFGDVDISYGVSSTDYDNLNGYLRHEVRGRIASLLDSETALTFTTTWAYDDSDNDTNDGATWDNQVGILKILTDKTRVAASAGYATSEIGDAETFSYDVNGTWLATEKTQINLIGRNSIRPSNSQNDTASIQNEGAVQLLLAHSDTLNSRFSVNLTLIDLEKGSESGQDVDIQEDTGDFFAGFGTGNDSDTVTLEYDLVYGPRGLNYNLFWETEYQVREEDNADNEYDNIITAVGILLHY